MKKVEFSGPFFTADIHKTLGANYRAMLEGMAREGEAAVAGAMPRKSGRTAGGVKGRVHSLGGKPWRLTMVISQTRIFPWRVHRSGSGSAIYRGGKLEARQHQFRRVGGALRRGGRAAIDLTKGLN